MTYCFHYQRQNIINCLIHLKPIKVTKYWYLWSNIWFLILLVIELLSGKVIICCFVISFYFSFWDGVINIGIKSLQGVQRTSLGYKYFNTINKNVYWTWTHLWDPWQRYYCLSDSPLDLKRIHECFKACSKSLITSVFGTQIERL